MKPFESIFTKDTSVLILGFGREGRSTYAFLQKNFPFLRIGIADKNEAIAGEKPDAVLHLGEGYLDALSGYDLVMKSPGVKLGPVSEDVKRKITSQTDLFLQHYGGQTVGVTGTKGKSTTVSLIYHLLRKTGKNALLMGNIGLPAFDFLQNIDSGTWLVYELSAHQLEFVHASPHWAVLLNLFPEHLDYFGNYAAYRNAKMNIFRYQKPGDFAFCGEQVNRSFPCKRPDKKRFQGKNLLQHSGLQGEHNLKNILLAFEVLESMGVSYEQLPEALEGFNPLPHRLEYVGKFGGVDFYNDSISTVPQSAIEAVKSIPETDALILGGYDRGLDYGVLVDFLQTSHVQYFFFMGKAGERMYTLFRNAGSGKKLFPVESLSDVFDKLKTISAISCCLLSPAAASYDRYHNFEHRGDRFKALARAFVRK